jgi:3-methylcrotonyl-CoA carboxylase alpha subunit
MVILGVGTNQAFLRDVIRNPAFREVLTTRFIPETFPDGWAAPPPPPGVFGAVAIAMAQHCQTQIEQSAPGAWGTLAGFRTGARAGLPARCRMQVQAPSSDPVTIDVIATPSGLRAVLDGVMLDEPVDLTALQVEDDTVRVSSGGAVWTIAATPLIQAMALKEAHASGSGSDVFAGMPGLIAQVLVVLDQEVRRGDVVIVQEAMKLMQPLTANTDGTVRAVHCTPGQIVAGGALLVEIEPPAPS